MPRVQRPRPHQKPDGHWYYRLRDEHGRRPEYGPFPNPTSAEKHGNAEAARIEKARLAARANALRGEGTAAATAPLHTLRDLIGEFRKLYTGAPKTVEEHLRLARKLETAPDPADPNRLFVDRELASLLPADLKKFINAFPSPHVRMAWCTLWSVLLNTAVDDLNGSCLSRLRVQASCGRR